MKEQYFKMLPSEKILLFYTKHILQNSFEKCPFHQTDDISMWKELYSISIKHGLNYFIGEKLIIFLEGSSLPKVIKIPWFLSNQKTEKRYQHYVKVADELTKLFVQHGIGMIQLKGVGFSANYPTPSLREGGDIDIFTYSIDLQKWSNLEANNAADEIIREKKIMVDLHTYKHSFFYYEGVPVENHKMFLNCLDIPLAKEMDKLLHQILFKARDKKHPIIGERTELLNGECMVYTPSAEFNTIFLAFHALQHLGFGLTLHHLVDWAVLLQKFGWCMPKEVKDPGFLSFVYALNQLCKEWFEIDVGTPEVPQKAAIVAEEILHPKYDYKKVPEESYSKIIWFKFRRMLHRHWLMKQFLKVSLTKQILKSIFGHIKNPKTIFN